MKRFAATHLILLGLILAGVGVSPLPLQAGTTKKTGTKATASSTAAKKKTVSSVKKTAGGSTASSKVSTKKKTAATSSTASSRRGKGSKKSSRKEVGQRAPTADRVSEIQQALAKDGSFAGTANGKWDDSTVEAMKKFQAGHGLNPTGKLDARTLNQLGLGSKTAGLGAPSRPVRVSSTAAPLGGTQSGVTNAEISNP